MEKKSRVSKIYIWVVLQFCKDSTCVPFASSSLSFSTLRSDYVIPRAHSQALAHDSAVAHGRTVPWSRVLTYWKSSSIKASPPFCSTAIIICSNVSNPLSRQYFSNSYLRKISKFSSPGPSCHVQKQNTNLAQLQLKAQSSRFMFPNI